MFEVKLRPAPVRAIVKQFFNSFQSRVFSPHTFVVLLLLCISAFGVAGCGGVVALGGGPSSSSGTNAATSITANPSTVDFGSVSVGNSATQKISLVNSGTDAVKLSELSLSNTAFRVDGEGKLPVTLAAGASLSLNVHFSPSSDSDISDQLNVIAASSSGAAAAVKLHGKGASGPAELSGLTCVEAQVSGAGSDSCTISSNIAAGPGGLHVHLSSNISAIKVPATAAIPSGASRATFSAAISKVSAEEKGTITATQGNNTKAFEVSLSPVTTSAGAPELKSLSCTQTLFTGAGKTACTVTLTAKSPKIIQVALASTSTDVTVPASATIAAGSTTASFNAVIAPVASAQSAVISASAGSSTRDISIELKPSKTSPATGSLSLSTSSLQFGDVAVGTAVTKSLTVTSTGNAPVTIKADSTTGAGFSVSGGSFPATLKPGQAVVLTAHFNPTAAGSASGQLTIASNAGTQSVSLAGNGTTTAPSLSALSCSSSSITGSLADTCKVTLSGSAPKGGLSIGLASSSSNVTVPSSITIPATAASATFAANATAVSTAQTVKLTATEGGVSRSISLQLSPALAQLSANATTISFGSVLLSQATTQVVTLTSVGKAPVTVQSVSVKGSGFSLSSVNLPATLNPGQTLALTLIYKASVTGSQTGVLTINSDSSTNPILTINLNATTGGHRVELSWSPPAASSNPVANYKVYRETGSSGGFAKVATTAQPTYTDTNVQSGTTYNYYVTSVGSAGGESQPSNTFTATIP
ncbi:choice-of-anchor D domain-containing protein [Occallatibacter savannae]|uniref:choice-of-anchor D domain-containing protein n=1 Tax=Occallatibacter savannae TaxID=1002691 RepID=UPI000D698AD7|nr:choice-of-anchor D domain-containing protein [Occallatibacter savannae]